MYNVNRFYNDYRIDGELEKPEISEVTDKWIMSRLNQVGRNVSEYYREYNTIKACSEIRKFVDDLSTWYVRLNRDRFNEGDKVASKVLRFVLDRFSKIAAPIIPFVSEKIYQNLYGEDESVHLDSWPEFDDFNEEISTEMMNVRDIVSMGLKFRDQNQIGLKWPLAKAVISCDNKISKELVKIIMQELNVRNVEFIDGDLGVSLDLNLSDELKAEGFSREVARKIQAGRKRAGLVKGDKISLVLNTEFEKVLGEFVESIKDRVGANDIVFGDVVDDGDCFDECKIKDVICKFSFCRS